MRLLFTDGKRRVVRRIEWRDGGAKQFTSAEASVVPSHGLTSTQALYEGAVKKLQTRSFVRDPRLRRRCIAHYVPLVSSVVLIWPSLWFPRVWLHPCAPSDPAFETSRAAQGRSSETFASGLSKLPCGAASQYELGSTATEEQGDDVEIAAQLRLQPAAADAIMSRRG